jgi:hypothetical protein
MQLDKKTIVVSILVLVAALTRLLPHPFNFSPIGAMALFGGCYIVNKRLAFLLPISAMLISDTLLELIKGKGAGFHPILLWVYLSFAVITCIGFYLRGRAQRQTIMVASLVGSVLFFLITNFGQWVTGYYGYGAGSLTTSFVNAIPFFRGTVLGDLFYNLVLFGSFAIIKWRFPMWLQPKKIN